MRSGTSHAFDSCFNLRQLKLPQLFKAAATNNTMILGCKRLEYVTLEVYELAKYKNSIILKEKDE